ncbi:VOC family protein [Streptomyces sp. NPDC001744]|uniref:VOC family protein n=1 Tax=Streptomyces sp. NPDC001744 TaxID=3364606 RepID=UPI0036829DB8
MSGATGGGRPPARRAFPVLRTHRVAATAAFYERLGFAPVHRHPAGGEPEFVAMRRDGAELAVSRDDDVPREPAGTVDLFVFVGSVDSAVEELRAAGTPVLREPADSPWGERVAYVRDPAGNRVGLGRPTA